MVLRSVIGISTLVAVGAVCLAVGALAAQTPPPGEDAQPAAKEQTPSEPKPTEAGADEVRAERPPSPGDIIREFQQQRPQLTPVLPTGPADETVRRASPDNASPGQRPRGRLPDGAMLADRAGRVVREGQWWVFAFESDNSSYPEPPMKLLPNQALERMVRESRGGMDPVVFVVTGEVTDFKAENYLLARKVLRKRNLGNLKK